MDIYTNSSFNRDFVENGFVDLLEKEMDVFIASAFFTDSDSCERILELNCHLRLVVRLGFPTCPIVLERLLQKKVDIRYFTSNSFHPKIYIFGNKNILVGSANFTRAGLRTNQEIMLQLNSSDSRFEKLTKLFDDYWDEAEVLDIKKLKKYKEHYSAFSAINIQIESFDQSIYKSLGENSFSNIERGKKKKNKKSVFIETYKKSYQECISAFNRIKEIYKQKPRRIPEQFIPLRMEIDSFISYVRDNHASGSIWENQPLGWNEGIKIKISSHVDKWMEYPYNHFDQDIVKVNYPLIQSVFNSIETIEKSTYEELIEAVSVLHSFNNRKRFYNGGLPTLKKEFLESNDLNKIKNTFVYLLFGKGSIVERMANCIYNEEYKLNVFGESNIQELVGWVNNENLPIINGKTTKVLRYYGFNVKQN
jgi:hypothetical protein